MMLAIDQAFAVVGIELQFAGDADTFTTTASDDNVYEIMQALVAWGNDVARPASWFAGSLVFSWGWQRDPATGGALLTLRANLPFDINTVTGGLNIPTMAAQTSSTGTDPAQGTWAPTIPISVGSNVRMLGEGDGGGGNLVRPGSPGLAGLSPKVNALGTALDAARLAAILAVAQTPRRAWVYQTHTATWLQLAIGAVNRSAEGATAYRFTLDAAGIAI